MASPLPEEKAFDPKKLGRLALARRSFSMEAELIKSSRWNIPSEDPDVQRPISLDSQVSTSSLDMSSLRTLGSSPSKLRPRNPSRDGASSRNEETRATNIAKMPIFHGGDGARETQANGLECAAGPQDTHRFTSSSSGSVNGGRGRTTSRPVRSFSICQGVGENAIAALSELGRRRSGEKPSIILPSNRPFLVGEHANRQQQREASTLSSTVSGNQCVPIDSSAQPGVGKDSSTETFRKEAPNITILSKLLFFGGGTPQKEATLACQSPPEAMQLSPDVTMVSQSDSCSSGDVQQSYLFQLGQIMGEVSVEPRAPVALQPPSRDFDESASTVSSLEHYSSVASNRKVPPERNQRFRSFLFLIAVVATALVSVHDNESFVRIYSQTKQALVPLASDAIIETRYRVEELTKQVLVTKAQTQWMERMARGVSCYVDMELALTRCHKASKLTRDLFTIAIDFILEPTSPPETILRPGSQWPTLSVDVISTALVATEKNTRTMNQTGRPSEGSTPEDLNTTHHNTADGSTHGNAVASSTAVVTLKQTVSVSPAKVLRSDARTMNGVIPETETETATEESSTDGFDGDCGKGTGTATTKDAVSITIQENDKATVRDDSAAMANFQHAAVQDLRQAMGKRVMTQLGRQNTSFSLSLSAQVGFHPKDNGSNFDSNSYQRMSSITLTSREAMDRNGEERLGRQFSEETFSCSTPSPPFLLAAGKSICRVFDSEKVGNDNEEQSTTELLGANADGDEFLHKPLVEVVGDFFRERRKRKQSERRDRKKRMKSRS